MMKTAAETRPGVRRRGGLRRPRARLSVPPVTRRQIQGLLLPALLAFAAIAGATALAGWHGALVHQHDAPVADAGHGTQSDHGDQDEGGPAHVVAHAVVQGVALPMEVAPARRLPVATGPWPRMRSVALAGHDPVAILRPPRA